MRKINKLLLLMLVVFNVAFVLAGCGCKHENLSEATCLYPQTCHECGKTFGEVSSEHNWVEATCKNPKECKICGVTDGEKNNEHIWVEATCTSPKKCTTCDLTEGDALGHSWVEATYEEPKRCTTCGETSGSPKERPPIEISITPSIPKKFSYVYSFSGKTRDTVNITNVRTEFEPAYDEGKYNIILYLSGEKTYDCDGPNLSRSCSIGIKVYDEDNYVVADETFYTPDLKVGDKFRDKEERIYEDLDGGKYRIELMSTN